MLRALRPLSVDPQPAEEVALAPVSQMRKLRCGETGELPSYVSSYISPYVPLCALFRGKYCAHFTDMDRKGEIP